MKRNKWKIGKVIGRSQFMGKASLTTPLLFRSKRLCFSLLYLLSTLFLVFYVSLSPTKCIFRSSPFDPIPSPLFSYPPNYGEHKYAISTARSSCTSSVRFSGPLIFSFSFFFLFFFFFCLLILELYVFIIAIKVF